MGKLSSILLGTVSGVAVALFLTSEKENALLVRHKTLLKI